MSALRYVWPDPYTPKRPGETDVFSCDFVRRLATAETIAAASVACCLKADAGETPIAAMVVGPASITGSVVSQRIAGGTDATDYTLIFYATTSQGREIEGVRDMPVARRWEDV